jgi:hypothetical protein
MYFILFYSGIIRDFVPPAMAADSRQHLSASPYLTRRNHQTIARGQQCHSPGDASDLGDWEGVANDDSSILWMDLDKLGNLFSHEGSSLYMRIGALCE